MEFFYHKHALFVGKPADPEAGSQAGLTASSINLSEWSRTQKTPFYLYDIEQIKKRVQFFKQSLPFIKSQNIHFAVKSNHNEKILKLLCHEGLGADTVSIGEIKRAIICGFSAQNIIFSGVAKTKTEIEQAVDLRIKQINIESYSELLRIIKICQKRNTTIDIGIRLNPRVAADTHKSISTGGADNKFGVDLSELESVKVALKENPSHVKLKSLSMHIGSNFLKLGELEAAIEILETHYAEFIREGFEINRLDLGGGLGIDYFNYNLSRDEELIKQYAELLKDLQGRHPNLQLMLEPGRVLVGRSAILVTQIQYIKKNGSTWFAVVDTGMNHLLRPALYEAHHQIWPLETKEIPSKTYSVAGPICESTDILATNVQLAIQEDDCLAILDCGAYGMSMSSSYNLHDFPTEYYFENGKISHLA